MTRRPWIATALAAGSGRAGLARLAALVLAALALLPLIGKSGIWDPYELDRADLARRIAIHVFGRAAWISRTLPGSCRP